MPGPSGHLTQGSKPGQEEGLEVLPESKANAEVQGGPPKHKLWPQPRLCRWGPQDPL